MRFLGLIFLLTLTVACGKKSSSSSSSACEGGTCEGIRQEADMNRPTELLEAKVDTTIKLTSNEIVFLQDASELKEAATTRCDLNVKAGDRYTYARAGDVLEVYKNNGMKMNMKRMSSMNDDSLGGSWAWRGYEGGLYKVVQFTFVGTGRIIMRLHCEN